MYEFTKWCFLCASDKNVNVNIKSLEEVIREHIGQFSIIVSFYFYDLFW
jgi:hypothetical protein